MRRLADQLWGLHIYRSEAGVPLSSEHSLEAKPHSMMDCLCVRLRSASVRSASEEWCVT